MHGHRLGTNHVLALAFLCASVGAKEFKRQRPIKDIM